MRVLVLIWALITSPLHLTALEVTVDIQLALISKEIAYKIAKAARMVPSPKAGQFTILKLTRVAPTLREMVAADLKNFLGARLAKYNFIYDTCHLDQGQGVMIPQNADQIRQLHMDLIAFVRQQPWFEQARLQPIEPDTPYSPKLILIHRQTPTQEELQQINKALHALKETSFNGVLQAKFADMTIEFRAP